MEKNESFEIYRYSSRFEKEDYIYSVEPTPSEFKERARACGYGLFELKGIPRRDYEKRRAHNRENFSFFDAPQVMIFHLPLGAERGNFLDMGFFMQNIMLGFESYGISSCPQFSLCSFSQTLREFLDIDRCIVSGLSVGYPDPEAIVNSYVPERLPLEEFVTWHS